MRNCIAKSSLVMFIAVAAIAGTAFAQDHDQTDRTQNADQSSQQRDQRNQSSEPRREHNDASRDNDRRDSEHSSRMASAEDRDVPARYRREHPHAAARCHDGFFTRTTDRNRACSKHDGIDVWLLQ